MKKKRLLLTAVATLGLTAGTMAQNFNWVKKIGGSSADYGLTKEKDISGNIIVSGYYSGTIDLDPSASIFNVTSVGGADVFILKLDPNGNFLWGKSIGGSNNEQVNDLTIDSTGNLYLCGFFRGSADFDPSSSNFVMSVNGGGISSDGFILKLDNNGNFIFAKQIGGTSTLDAHVISLDLDNQNNIYATGYFKGNCDLDPGIAQYNVTSIGSSDIFIIKLNSLGNFLFGKTIGSNNGTIGPISSLGHEIIVNANHIFITGRFDGTADFDPGSGINNITSNGLLDCYLLKLDLSGNFIFAKSFGGTGNDETFSLKLDLNDNIYICGLFNSTVDFDPNPGTANLTSNGLSDGFLLKLDNLGNYEWSNHLGGTGEDYVYGVTCDPSNNIFVTGCFSNTVDFDNSTNQLLLNSNGLKDIFVAGYNTNGNIIYSQNFGSSLNDEGAEISSFGSEIYLTGYFQNTVDFDASSNTFNLTSSGTQDAFVLKLTNSFCTQTITNTITVYDTVTVYQSVTDTLIINTSVTGINPPNNINTIKVFPNPASTHITIDYGNVAIMNGYQLKIENSLGQQVYQTNIIQQIDYLSLSTWGGNGLYFVHIIDPQGNTIDIRKIVLQ